MISSRLRRPAGASRRSWREIVRLPVFLLANVALLLVIGVSTVRETYRGWSVDHEISALEAQASSLEGQKTQLETLAQDLVSPDRVEYEARARLGLKKPGERVIVLEGLSTTTTWTGDGEADPMAPQAAQDLAQSNPSRWWSYFFHS
jgi:cell division protein FtsB